MDVEEGRTTVSCRFCATPQAIVGERGFGRYMVLDRIRRAHASQAIRRWFKKGIRKEPALKREARFDESFLAWFPFIRTRCDVVGWVLGINERREKRGKRWVTVQDPVECQVEQPIDRTMPATRMAEFGVSKVNLAGDEILALNEDLLRSRGMVFRPTRSADEISERIIEVAMEEVKRRSSPDKTSFAWFAVLRPRTDILYYPMWVFRYSFRGRTYQVLVDGEDGTLAYGKAPGNHLWRAFSVIAACAGASFVGTTVLQNVGSFLHSEITLAALGIIGLILAGLIHWGFRQFRRGGIVEEGSGLAPDSDYSALGSMKSVARELGLD